MTHVFLPFLTAIALSIIAGFYSVVGLAQIFPGSFFPIIIMGSVLEISKLVTVSWLYNNWDNTNRLLKLYFLIAIMLLMLITSMGIFGFLSRSHIESNVVVGENSVQLQILENQENITKERLEYLLKKAGDDPTKIARSTDRAIQETQEVLRTLTEKKLPLLEMENKLSAEIGPIKYVAELIYDKSDPTFIDKAVRILILIIIFVFDPLAVLLLIASQQTFKRIKKKDDKTLDIHVKNDVKYDNSRKKYEIIPKEDVAQFKKDGDIM
jgi:hypothetical protein